MAYAKFVAQRSKDNSRKTGCVFVDYSLGIVASGHNEFPRRVADTPHRRERPFKYIYTEHAERNAIYWAARTGIPLLGTRVYLTWFPCVECARALVQAGVVELIAYEPDWNEARYDFLTARTILEEGYVTIRYMVPE